MNLLKRRISQLIQTDNTKKALTKLWFFWFALLIPLIVGVYISIDIGGDNDILSKFWCISWNDKLDMFKVPIGIFATSIPSVAVVAAIHRSNQTARMIKEQTGQNAISNYYNHLRRFEDHWDKISKDGNIKIIGSKNWHDFLFPGYREGDCSINEKFLNKFINLNLDISNSALYLCHKAEERTVISDSDFSNRIHQYKISSSSLFDFLFIEIRLKYSTKLNGENITKKLISITKFIDNIVKFEGGYNFNFEQKQYTTLNQLMMDQYSDFWGR